MDAHTSRIVVQADAVSTYLTIHQQQHSSNHSPNLVPIALYYSNANSASNDKSIESMKSNIRDIQSLSHVSSLSVLVTVDPSVSVSPSAAFRTLVSSTPAIRCVLPFPRDTAAEKVTQQWIQSMKLDASRVILEWRPSEAPSISPQSAKKCESFASAWLCHMDAASSFDKLTSFMQSITLPLFIKPVFSNPTHSHPVGSTLLALNELAQRCSTLQNTHLLAPFTHDIHNASILVEHWNQLQAGDRFRSSQRKVAETSQQPLSSAPKSASSTTHTSTTTATSTTTSAPSSSSEVATAPPANFYRATFTPSTMFYRLSIQFSPPLDATGSCPTLTAHGLLQEALKSFLGGVGSAKVDLQLLEWSEENSQGIVCINAEMSVGARAAFTLTSAYQGKTCRIDVMQQSLFLSALSQSMTR